MKKVNESKLIAKEMAAELKEKGEYDVTVGRKVYLRMITDKNRNRKPVNRKTFTISYTYQGFIEWCNRVGLN